ncbi:polysaccharide deacetylase family protein [Klebsiella pasteurii]|uniref:polysaccharide deacetylase family protein n=1 Tax=Klebsiella pasteurii TaxID=2587529 RepID=UPI00292C7CBE|nr:polysaccharide deacetylase family protein [Klebsiella pasteurii]MDV1069714.1 polysaccharide deacetylase family protein [Klebsiella pasteurii]MDV1075729.1 polysaccharide deacetylase family protein [Klebsiella pasteurii]
MHKPAFLITIDTEGDNLWQKHDSITTENARYLPRFQQLCEKYGFKPVWLTNYEMAIDPVYIEFAKDTIARGTAEIGMHLHAWNSPPTDPLTDDDWRHKPYLIEYSDAAMRAKVDYMTRLLEDTFQTKMVSHRAGRWAFDERYARLLVEYGYLVDCSVTPRVNWKTAKGAPQGDGGTDYRHFPQHAYFLDENDIRREGQSSLLEVPMSIQYKHSAWMNSLKQGYDRLRGKVRSPSVHWLRPMGGNVETMKKVVEQTLTQGNDYVEYMLHSSEYMPGGSPTFKNEQDIERLYADLDAFFSWLAPQVKGMTLAEYYQQKLTQP